MQNTKPYLAVYNGNTNSKLKHINQDEFDVVYFDEIDFNQELCQSIIEKTKKEIPVVILDAKVKLPEFWFERLSQVFKEKTDAKLCSALTCGVYELSPLLEGDEFNGTVEELDGQIYLTQSADTFYTDKINLQCFMVKTPAVLANLKQTPYTACNNLLVQSQKQPTLCLTDIKKIGDQKPLPAHPLADLQWRLKTQLNNQGVEDIEDIEDIEFGYPLLDKKPTMLHITMGWGGGVHQWIDDYCRNEPNYHHLILSSDGELYRQSHGENFILHYQQTQGMVMQRFEMQAPIKATCIEHPEYLCLLNSVIKQYQVQQVVVSSLIGHSMQCLQTGLPTLRVLHDYFPSWPSLIANLDKAQLTQADMLQALQQTKSEPFGEIKRKEFESWQKAAHLSYVQENIQLVAPSESVVRNLRKINASAFKQVTIIPHAIAFFPAIKYSNNNKTFQILLLGRINPAKGQDLLESIIQELGKDYHFVFMGAGNEGKKYLNTPNISVIMDYNNAELGSLLQEIEPDLALITSQTSETFNYTLSELQQAGICTISTKFGALKDRISDGKTGFLCENSAQDFVDKIQELRNNPKQVQAVRDNLSQLKQLDFTKTRQQYERLLGQTTKPQYRLTDKLTHNQSHSIVTKKLIAVDAEKQRVESILATTEVELDERTLWGKKLTKNLKKAEKDIALERQEAKKLQGIIQVETTRMNAEIRDLQQAFKQSQSQYEQEHKKLQQTEIDLCEVQLDKEEAQLNKESVEQELSSVYQSRSWRVTKPLRSFTTWARHKRNAAKYRLAQLRTLPSRAIRSLKTRGLSGTATAIKNKLNKKSTQAKSTTVELTQNFTALSFNTVEQPNKKPTVSIVIPVFNHFEHTYNCLKSISELQDKATFEIIVVDDCSSDDTPALIKKISGISYQRQKQNGGFIESCNTGAKLAKGEYLMFLNNDTMVHNQWLDALLEVFEQHSDAGLVGSKLVYPNGQLQEAGGIVFSDASGWNYGRLGNPDEPQFNHVREVDYCSGASILISNELFVELGSFDERYKPAYYEDTDMAFAVRNIGKKVYFQPLSKVTHFEGISSGTDLTQGMKKYQVVNQVKFKEKWAKQLTKQPKAGTDIELCRIHEQPKRILIFDACTPTPDQDSGSLRMINLIKILKELGYHVVFMPENFSQNGGYTQDLEQLGVECLYRPHVSNPVGYLKDKGQYLDAVILSRYYVAEQVMPFIREYCPKAQIIFDTVDLHYVREHRMAELSNDNKLAKMAEATKQKELAVAKVCDVTLVVSPYEVEVLAKVAPDVQVKVLSNIHEVYGCRKGFKERKDIMFIGGYQHTPNVDAIEWFVAEIFPLIEKELPDLKFHIVGSKAPKHIKAMAKENIIFRGFVEDIEPIMDDIRIAIAPLRYGAGVKGKVNMSMSYGQPVVGTKVAVEGMYAQEGIDVLMAETAQEFANQVIRLYNDEELWNTISQGGLANVQNYFSFQAAKQAVDDILN